MIKQIAQKIDRRLRKRSFNYALRRNDADYAASINEALPPLVIYQMGKVGSSSVNATLTAELTDFQVFQVHVLTSEWRNRLEEQYREASKAQGRVIIDRHVNASRYLAARWARRTAGEKWHVVSLVRDPVARNISTFFQAFPVYFAQDAEDASDGAISRYDSDELLDKFMNEFGAYRHSVPTVWFQTHMQPMFGIDVYARDFDHERKYTIYENDCCRLLLLRAEDVDTTLIDAVEAFTGVRPEQLIRANDASDKTYADVYKQFKSRFTPPAEYLDQLYDSEFAKHFYTAEELAGFRERWLAS